MANPDHVDQLLRAGDSTRTWNDWREANPHILPDLSDLNQYDTSLAKANLQNLNLRGAILLSGALGDSYTP
ncbi:hypothetical protein [Candidatus Entotheonella palauensis]|uniref:hypothetical protein n=1 Tax=Candidatus Entotheonella palauensis TaxID=93172 RepID=UPI000B7FB112|nr:hypothetical protein [Candidatus Entotheonella palauensis]